MCAGVIHSPRLFIFFSLPPLIDFSRDFHKLFRIFIPFIHFLNSDNFGRLLNLIDLLQTRFEGAAPPFACVFHLISHKFQRVGLFVAQPQSAARMSNFRIKFSVLNAKIKSSIRKEDKKVNPFKSLPSDTWVCGGAE